MLLIIHPAAVLFAVSRVKQHYISAHWKQTNTIKLMKPRIKDFMEAQRDKEAKIWFYHLYLIASCKAFWYLVAESSQICCNVRKLVSLSVSVVEYVMFFSRSYIKNQTFIFTTKCYKIILWYDNILNADKYNKDSY